MAILKIARMGHPILHQRAQPVEDPSAQAVSRFIADMVETMDDAHGVGLAAPQVHVGLRILIFFVPEERVTQYPGDGPVGLTALINPEIDLLGDETNLGWEGCLSIPGLRGAVPRHTHIRYRGQAPDGTMVDRTVAGFHARVVQHEFDHLNGILYPERMKDHRLLAFVEESARFPIDLSAYGAEVPT
jgi:peptide deformylase